MVQVVLGSMHMLMYFLGGLPDDPRTMWVFLAQLCWNRAQAVLGYPHCLNTQLKPIDCTWSVVIQNGGFGDAKWWDRGTVGPHWPVQCSGKGNPFPEATRRWDTKFSASPTSAFSPTVQLLSPQVGVGMSLKALDRVPSGLWGSLFSDIRRSLRKDLTKPW